MTSAVVDAPRAGVRALLPVGLPLSDADWAKRHRLILIVIALNLPVLALLWVFGGHRSSMADEEICFLVLCPAAIALLARSHRSLASAGATVAMLGVSASMIELLGGATTAHFDFFVSLTFIALYQSWPIYLLAVAFTAGHHLIMAFWMPMQLFAPGSAESHHPVLWALVHAAFILAACAAQVTFWRFAEASQIAATTAQAQSRQMVAEQLAAEHAASEQRAAAANELAESFQAQQASRRSVDAQLGVLSRSAGAVSGGVSSAAESVSAIDDAIREIATSASSVSDVATGAVALVQGTSTSVLALSGEVVEISRLVGSIAGIAAQTNLLALNATIEAARAGDAGKGFAVVAAEVKELARNTADATETIGAIAGRVQSGTDAALASMNEVSKVIDQMNGYTTTIAAAVEEQSATTAQTRSAFADVADGANEIAVAVQKLAAQA